MEKYEKTYWWHIGKKNLVREFIRKYKKDKELKILEIGCGAGEITEMLTEFGKVYANDVAKLAINKVQERGIKNTIHGDINSLDLKKYENKFDIVLSLDVLEHIKEDTKVMANTHKMLKGSGKFLITAPAYKFLWSMHDEALEHQRRYTDYELKTKLEDNGFRIIKQSHFVFFAFPVIALVKFLSNFFSKKAYPNTSYIELPGLLNDLMVKTLSVEIFLMKRFNLPFGTTIVVVAEKIKK